MRLPDVRSEFLENGDKNPYWEGNLDGIFKNLLDEYDFAVHALSTFFDNLDGYDFDIPGEDINLHRFLENHPKIMEQLKEAFADYAESQRTENVVSMLEG